MTQETLAQANMLNAKIGQCEKALKYHTNGTFHIYDIADKDMKELCPLPEEVCVAIRAAIEQCKREYEGHLAAL